MISRSLRNEFAGLSTGNENGRYYPSKGVGVEHFAQALANHEHEFDYAELQDCTGDEGYKVVRLYPAGTVEQHPADSDGRAFLSWYRMPSGRWELIGYIS